MSVSVLDWGIVLAYFALSIGIGLKFTKKGGESLEEYFVAGRAVSWWLAGSAMIATTFAADTPLVVTGVIRFVNGWTRPFRFDVAPGGNWELWLPGLLSDAERAAIPGPPFNGALKAFGELRCDKECKAKVVAWYDDIRKGVVPTIQNVEWSCPE